MKNTCNYFGDLGRNLQKRTTLAKISGIDSIDTMKKNLLPLLGSILLAIYFTEIYLYFYIQRKNIRVQHKLYIFRRINFFDLTNWTCLI